MRGFDKHLCRVLLTRLMEEVVRQTALENASAAHALAKRKAVRARQLRRSLNVRRGLMNPRHRH